MMPEFVRKRARGRESRGQKGETHREGAKWRGWGIRGRRSKGKGWAIGGERCTSPYRKILRFRV